MIKRILDSYLEVENDVPMATSKFPFLYLIHNKHTKLTKVGITNNINSRINQLSAQNGVLLDLVIYLECADGIDANVQWLESFIHNHFTHKRKIGEWFDFNLRDVVEIRSLLWYIQGDFIEDQLKELIANY
jgi:hypothetical protein